MRRETLFYSEWNREPVKIFQDGGDVIVLAYPQDPGSAALDVL